MFTVEGVTCITGACSAIGRATQTAFANSGCESFILIDISQTGLQELARNINKSQPSIKVVTHSCNPQSAEDLGQAIGSHSQQDIAYFVNCPSSEPQSSNTLDMNVTDFKTTLDELQRATWIAMRAQVRHSISRSPSGPEKAISIINVVAVQGHAAQPNFPAYAAANSGIIGSSKGVALDFIHSNIRVNCVCHGVVETFEPALSSHQRKLADAPPASAIVTAEQVAAAAVYLSSRLAKMITGTSLILDGGWSLSHF